MICKLQFKLFPLISGRQYKLLLINSGLIYRYSSKLIIENNVECEMAVLKRLKEFYKLIERDENNEKAKIKL